MILINKESIITKSLLALCIIVTAVMWLSYGHSLQEDLIELTDYAKETVVQQVMEVVPECHNLRLKTIQIK